MDFPSRAYARLLVMRCSWLKIESPASAGLQVITGFWAQKKPHEAASGSMFKRATGSHQSGDLSQPFL
jgi:hypothetical protein